MTEPSNARAALEQAVTRWRNWADSSHPSVAALLLKCAADVEAALAAVPAQPSEIWCAACVDGNHTQCLGGQCECIHTMSVTARLCEMWVRMQRPLDALAVVQAVPPAEPAPGKHGRFCKAFGAGTNSTGNAKDCDCHQEPVPAEGPQAEDAAAWRKIAHDAAVQRDEARRQLAEAQKEQRIALRAWKMAAEERDAHFRQVQDLCGKRLHLENEVRSLEQRVVERDQQIAQLREAAQELNDAAEDYRIHSETSDVEDLARPDRLMAARNAMRLLLAAPPATGQEKGHD